ncbi:hypothetical protein HJC23_003882 [Cyclotella cryptica]|uniref:Uncharacterized protein n=1 Tax=Cyclotella cryptica TaxID=29204 RepID=A0ABD3PR69_9STRA
MMKYGSMPLYTPLTVLRYLITLIQGEYCVLKKKLIGEPKIHLDEHLRNVILPNQQEAWAFGSVQYMKAAVKNVEENLHKSGCSLLAHASTHLSPDCCPDVDFSKGLGSEKSTYFQSSIGVLQWMDDLGHVDVCCEVSMMFSHLALPRRRHLEELFHVFAYLQRTNSQDQTYWIQGLGIS